MKQVSFAISLIPFAFLALFLLYPLAAIFALSFAPRGELDLSGAREIVTDPYYLRVIGFTFAQAALSTLLTILAAFPAAYVLSHFRLPAQNLMRAFITIPFLMPTIVIAAAFNALFGPRGWLNAALMQTFRLDAPPLDWLNTIWIILLAHVFYNFSIVVRIVGGFWSTLSAHYADAARALGANRARAFFEVTLPLLAPALVAAALLIFVFDFTSFGVILLLGGARMATLEVEIYRQTVNIFNLPLAAALALVQIVCTVTMMFAYTRLQDRFTRPLALRPRSLVQSTPHTRREKILVAIILGVTLAFLGLPLGTLIVESLRADNRWGMQNYTDLFENVRGSITFVPPIDAVRNSLLFALAAMIVALGIGMLAANSLMRARKKLRAALDALYMLPLGASAVTLGFGFLIALDRPPLELRATIYLVPLAHALIGFPFVLRALLPILQSIQPQLRDAARVLGASPSRVWREIDLPIIARALVVGGIFAFVISLGEFGATALIALPEFPTMPLAIYRLLGEPGIGHYGQALAMSVILMFVSALAIVAAEKFRGGEAGEF